MASPFLTEIETQARRGGARLVVLSLPDFWRLTHETKLLGCGCGKYQCLALPGAICTDNIRCIPYPSFDDPPKYLRGHDPNP